MPTFALVTGPVPYTSVDGDELSLYVWRGQHVALLTASADYDPSVMIAILEGLDRAYEAYVQITGREPTPYLTYDGLTSIAEVPTAQNGQAAAIGYVGLTGIEITPGPFSSLYTGVRDNGWFDQALFYELGRNFFFYRDQIDPIAGTGFAIVNRFISLELAGLTGGPFGQIPFDEFKSSILDGLSATFFSSPDLTIQNTLFAETAPPNSNNWSYHDFAASLLYQVYQNFGLTTYRAFYEQLEQLPLASDKAAAFANLINAATAATGVDFGFLDKAAGETYVVGTAGSDTLHADGSLNPVLALGGSDEIIGSRKADLILAGGGGDVVAGSKGDDRIYGGLGADSLKGEHGDDWLDGGNGDDVINGGPGRDILVGGAGRDELTGGSGKDVFQFGHEIFLSPSLEDADRILDFSRGDRIDLSLIDATEGTGDDAFVFIGDSAFTATLGELRYEYIDGNTTVQGDVNGDGVADFMIHLIGGKKLSATDFLL